MILKDFEATSDTMQLMVEINVALGEQFCQKIGNERVKELCNRLRDNGTPSGQ